MSLNRRLNQVQFRHNNITDDVDQPLDYALPSRGRARRRTPEIAGAGSSRRSRKSDSDSGFGSHQTSPIGSTTEDELNRSAAANCEPLDLSFSSPPEQQQMQPITLPQTTSTTAGSSLEPENLQMALRALVSLGLALTPELLLQTTMLLTTNQRMPTIAQCESDKPTTPCTKLENNHSNKSETGLRQGLDKNCQKIGVKRSRKPTRPRKIVKIEQKNNDDAGISETPDLQPTHINSSRSETGDLILGHVISPATGNKVRRNYKNMTRERRVEANARERTRVHTIGSAFDRLRSMIPCLTAEQKLSKLSILRIACHYILLLGAMNGQDFSADQRGYSVSDCVSMLHDAIIAECKSSKHKLIVAKKLATPDVDDC